MNWYDAVKVGIPSKEEWMAIAENLDAVNKALIRAGGEPLKRDWYWSSSEYSSYSTKYGNGYVRPVLAL